MMKMTRLGMLWLSILLCTAQLSQAQQTSKVNSFSLQQTLDYAKRNNTQVKNALLNLQIQRQVNRGITALALPNIGGNIAATEYFDVPTQVIPGDAFGGPPGSLAAVQFGLKYNSTASLQLQQLLFDGQVFVGLQARKASIDFQTKNVEVTTEAIKANVHKVYYQLVVSKTQVQLIDANISRLEKLLSDAKALFKSGFAEKLDVDKINVQITNLQTQKLSILNSIEMGYLGLKTLIGMPAKETLQLTDSISEADIKEVNTVANYQYADRKEYQYAMLGKKLNEYNIKRYQLAYLPTLALSGTYAKQAFRTDFSFFKKGDWYPASYVSLNLSIPLFDGFAKDAKVKQAKLELQQTSNSIDNLQKNIDSEVQQATLNYKTAIATIDFQRKNMELAESVYSQTKKKFEVGTGSNTEISAAQTDLITAQTNYINALYSAIIAKVDFAKAIGKL